MEGLLGGRELTVCWTASNGSLVNCQAGVVPLQLQTIMETVAIAGLIIGAIFLYFHLTDDSTPFSRFWYGAENPIPVQEPMSQAGWVGIVITVTVGIILILVGFLMVAFLQNQLPSFNGCYDLRNMSAICQNWRSIISNAN